MRSFPSWPAGGTRLGPPPRGGNSKTRRAGAMVITRIVDAVAALCRQGMAILLVEQMVEAALRLADHAYLIETGKIVGEGSAEPFRRGDALLSVCLGRHAAD